MHEKISNLFANLSLFNDLLSDLFCVSLSVFHLLCVSPIVCLTYHVFHLFCVLSLSFTYCVFPFCISLTSTVFHQLPVKGCTMCMRARAIYLSCCVFKKGKPIENEHVVFHSAPSCVSLCSSVFQHQQSFTVIWTVLLWVSLMVFHCQRKCGWCARRRKGGQFVWGSELCCATSWHLTPFLHCNALSSTSTRHLTPFLHCLECLLSQRCSTQELQSYIQQTALFWCVGVHCFTLH